MVNKKLARSARNKTKKKIVETKLPVHKKLTAEKEQTSGQLVERKNKKA